MGYLTLQRFRDELNLSLGDNRQTGNERLDSWINLGYFETANDTDFEGLKMVASADTVANQATYSLPTDLFAILSIADLTNERKLLKMGLQNYHRKDRSVTGEPRYYARRKRVMYLWPTPDDVFDIEIYYVEEICPLTDTDDVTVFPQSFDAVVLAKARKHAWMALGNETKATFYENLGSRELSKISVDTEDHGELAQGIEIPSSLEELTRMQTDIPR